MHSEHLQNVRIVILVGGWLVAAAATSLIALAFVGFGAVEEPATATGAGWTLFAVIAGFWAGGLFTGLRAVQAPVLHGIGIGVASLVVWVAVNILAAFLPDAPAWTGLTPGLALGLLLAQMAAAVVGALMGYNIALRGKPGLSEHEPVD